MRGAPGRIRTCAHGSCYRSRNWRDLLSSAGIAHKRIRPYRPQGLTPSAYIARIRLEAAKALILSGESVASAAVRSGLGSDETLRRVLKSAAAKGH
ncbi:hypothetical protein [Streptomyces sp. NPDC058255]|uniref:hypothetical protein n=1 Tax=Streptomyces sp. NPDC058255 TaxID=3346407 RepID=UPI0036E1ABA4